MVCCLKTTLEFLKLCFEGVDTLGELLPVLLILLAQPPGRVGAHQSYNRKNEDKPNETQPDQYAEEFHRYDSERIAAYASTETESKQ